MFQAHHGPSQGVSGGVSGGHLVLVGLYVFPPVRITTFSWAGGGEPSCTPKSPIPIPRISSGFLLHLSLVTQQLWTVAGVEDAFWQRLSLALARRPGKLSHFLSGPLSLAWPPALATWMP